MVEESAVPDLENLARRERLSTPANPEELAEIHERAIPRRMERAAGA